MTKKKIVMIISILIAAVIVAFTGVFIFHKQKLQKGIQDFGIHETDDITISDYDDNIGLWNDQILYLSTQKDFDLFVEENIIVPITITDESDSQSGHVILFEYTNGNRKIYGRFSASSNSEINNVSLQIND